MEMKIAMSRKQLKRAHVIQNYNEGKTSRKEAAAALGITERQITRLSKGMKENGEVSLIHKNTGRKPTHALKPEVVEQIVLIRKSECYQGCNISHFQELLNTHHGIQISYKPLYNLLREAGIQSPQKHKKKAKHHRRKRKAQAGELLQIDATPYEWFGNGTKYALHAAIDDATGQITGAYMTQNECMHGYFEIIRQTCLEHGVPLSVYSDKHTIFRSPKTEKLLENGDEPNPTQFGRALAELGANIIHANSPQAKGRIERLWVTLQSRLPVEFRLRGIVSMEQANQFLTNEFIAMFNQKFSVEAEGSPIFVPYTHSENIDNILCIKETRKLDNAGSFSFHGESFKILDEGYPIISARATVLVLVSTRQPLQVQYKGQAFHVVSTPNALKEKTKAQSKKSKQVDIQAQVEPHLTHGTAPWKNIWHYEDYHLTMNFLFELFFKKQA